MRTASHSTWQGLPAAACCSAEAACRRHSAMQASGQDPAQMPQANTEALPLPASGHQENYDMIQLNAAQ